MELCESMPKLVLRTPTSVSPTESPGSSVPRVVRFGPEDGFNPNDVQQFQLQDKEQRQDFLHSAGTIAHKIKSAASFQKLCEALETTCDYDDCTLSVAQLLPALAQALGALSAATFLPLKFLITKLTCCLENTVLIETTEAIRQLFVIVDDDCILQYLAPMIVSLITSRWSSPRAVGVGLLVELAKRTAADDERHDLCQKFSSICHEEQSIQVQRAACRNLHHWVSVVDKSLLSSFLIPLFHFFLANEKHDTLQIELVPQLLQVGVSIGRHMTAKYLQHMYHAACSHTSWRVRFVAASCIGSFVSMLSKPETLLGDFLTLSKDEEVATVSATLKQFHVFACYIPPADVERDVLPALDVWIASPNRCVRCAIAESIFSVVLRCPRSSMSVLRKLLLLADDVDEAVQITALSSLSHLADHAADNADARTLIMDRINQGSRSPKWRVREAIVRQLHQFCSAFSEDVFLPLETVVVTTLGDSVACVRSSAVDTMEIIARQYGPSWSAKMFCRLTAVYFEKRENPLAFHSRVIAANFTRALLPVASGVHPNVADGLRFRVEAEASRLLNELASDNVSNVRVAVAKCVIVLKTCRCTIAEATQQSIYQQLLGDDDADVVKALVVTGDEPY